MRERLRLEKEKKNSVKEVDNSKANGAKQKRKQTEDGADSQKKKKKTQKQTEGDKEKDQKAKEKEEKKKKKDEEQQRQKCLLEARKAQAASRWASTSSENQEITIFTPEPVRQTNTTRPCQSLIDLTPPAQQTLHPTTGSQNTETEQLTTPLQRTSTETSLQRTSTETPLQRTSTETSLQRNQTARDRHTIQPRSQSKGKTPAGPTNAKRTSAPRRGLHFQSAVAESSDEEIDEDIEDDGEQIEIISDHGSSDCCKEKKLEIEALRKRLEKVHKRLNIALKAKTSEDVENNRPAAGILDKTLATEYKMVEVMEGSGVYWYPHQRAYCSAFKSWAGYVNAATDIFFSKETLAISNAKGDDKRSKNGGGHQPLNPLIIQALVGKVCSKFAKDSPPPSQVIQKINMKCVEARRPPRVRVLTKNQE
ncbi:uncharacterized protein LOC144635551 [Oculina patagonica]